MAAILASLSCGCRVGDLTNQRLGDDLSFSGNLSNYDHSRFDKDVCSPVRARKLCRLQVAMQQTDLSTRAGTNGRPIKMVPTTEVKKTKTVSISTSEGVNGSTKNVNGSRVVNGGSLIKRDPAPPISKTSKTNELPPIEGLKVLPSDEGFSWANENYNSFQRSIDVWSFVLSLRVRVLLDNAKWSYIGGFSEDKQAQRRRGTASWLRECVLQLGPTFIKLGQLSSTRSDLFPKEFVEELAKLQDRVPAFSPSKAKSFIENELGAPISVLYKEFEDLPIAAASLGQVFALCFPLVPKMEYVNNCINVLDSCLLEGPICQVHRAILHNRETVVVKVQRPGLKKLFDIDLKNLKLIAEYFQKSETLVVLQGIGLEYMKNVPRSCMRRLIMLTKEKMLIDFVVISEI